VNPPRAADAGQQYPPSHYTVDTNVLIRAVIGDDSNQAAAARRLLAEAELVAITLPTLCEFVWVLRRGLKRDAAEIELAIRTLIEARKVHVDRPAVEAGLRVLQAGGDFADGVIAHDGEWLGGVQFVSFDRQAVRLLQAAGREARLLVDS
jgi:predicted nucleic-acid-binding protein